MTAAAECMIPAPVAQRSAELLAAIERMIVPRPQMKVRGGRRRHGQRSTQQANRYANGGVVWIDEAYR